MLSARIFCIGLVVAPLFCQERPAPPHVVRATAEATITAKPDRAQIIIGVVTESAVAKDAATQNAAQTMQLIEALKRAVKGRGEIATANYSIQPQYEYENGKPPRLSKYQANNSVLVTVDDLSLVGEIIDSAANAGANTINGINFTLKNDEAVRNQALAEAAVKARASAEAIAHALNLQVVGIMEAQAAEAANIVPVRPMMQSAGLVKAVPATPVETGTLEIRESVVVTLQVQ